MKHDSILKAAITGVLAFSGLIAAGNALAADDGREQCAGIAKAGKKRLCDQHECLSRACDGRLDRRSLDLSAQRHLRSHRRRAHRQRQGSNPEKVTNTGICRTPAQTRRGTSGPNGATAVNSKPDPRVTFDPDLTPRDVEASRTTWLPSSARRDYPIAHTYWLTRASRGISWHRSGRVLAREQLR